MYTETTTSETVKNYCDKPLPDFDPIRSCCANDLILVSEGVQCTNCGNLRDK